MPAFKNHLLYVLLTSFVLFSASLGQYRNVFNQKTQKVDTCLEACKTQTYSLLVTNSNYPTQETFKYTKEFCYVVLKLLQSCQTRGKPISKKYPKLCQLISILKANLYFISKKCDSKNKLIISNFFAGKR